MSHACGSESDKLVWTIQERACGGYSGTQASLRSRNCWLWGTFRASVSSIRATSTSTVGLLDVWRHMTQVVG